jgi:DNA-binding MarR family transcriptional regulator
MASARDRRQKLVARTAKGARVKQALTAEYLAPPRNLLERAVEELETLTEILERMHPRGRSTGED